tara:strand:- start:77 stop:910 length:834 start_codon:yes stop_codon:yes gene_type:complete
MLNTTRGKDIAVLYQKSKPKKEEKKGDKKEDKKKPKKKEKKKGDKILQTYKLYDDNFTETNPNKVEEIDIHDDTKYFFPLPQKHSERIYISAPSGAGKSTFIGKYLGELRKVKGKKRPIFIFSRVENDEPLDVYKPIRIPLDRKIFDEEPLKPEDFRDCILVFDDIDTLIDKPLLKYLQHFRDDLLECGRHYGITTISTTHQILNFAETRKLLNEATAIIIFPKATGNYQLRSFLERYMGFDKEQIEHIKTLPSRWLYLSKEYPLYMIYEKGIVINS